MNLDIPIVVDVEEAEFEFTFCGINYERFKRRDFKRFEGV
jgi:hypothetical protein